MSERCTYELRDEAMDNGNRSVVTVEVLTDQGVCLAEWEHSPESIELRGLVELSAQELGYLVRAYELGTTQ